MGRPFNVIIRNLNETARNHLKLPSFMKRTLIKAEDENAYTNVSLKLLKMIQTVLNSQRVVWILHFVFSG